MAMVKFAGTESDLENQSAKPIDAREQNNEPAVGKGISIVEKPSSMA